MEVANAWCYRSRACHDLSARAFRLAFNRKIVEAAAKELAAAAPDVRAGMAAQNQIAKVGKVLKYIDEDPAGRSHYKCLVLQKPLHFF